MVLSWNQNKLDNINTKVAFVLHVIVAVLHLQHHKFCRKTWLAISSFLFKSRLVSREISLKTRMPCKQCFIPFVSLWVSWTGKVKRQDGKNIACTSRIWYPILYPKIIPNISKTWLFVDPSSEILTSSNRWKASLCVEQLKTGSYVSQYMQLAALIIWDFLYLNVEF